MFGQAPDTAVFVRHFETARFREPFECTDASGLLGDAQALLHFDPVRGLLDDYQDATDRTVVADCRTVVEVKPDILGLTGTVEHHVLVPERERAATEHRVDHLAIEVGHFRPALRDGLAQHGRMTQSGDGTVGIIVKKHALASLEQGHRGFGTEHEGERLAQRVRPCLDRSQRTGGPVQVADQSPQFAIGGKEPGRVDRRYGHVADLRGSRG